MKRYRILLTVLIASSLFCITALFLQRQQRPVHIDETWQYLLANGDGGYRILEDSNGNTRNLDTWISTDVLRRMLTVSRGGAFDFSDMIKNAASDTKGPGGYVFLHILSGLFPDTYSVWFMYAINAVCFVLTQIFLYLLVLRITKSPAAGLLAAGYYGFTAAAFSSVIFLRMYMQETALVVIFSFLLSGLVRQETFRGGKWADALFLIPITAFGGLTDYLFLIYAGCAVFLFLIAELFERKKTMPQKLCRMLVTGIFPLCGVILMFLVYPQALSQMLREGTGSALWGIPLAFSFQIWYMNSILFREQTGIALPIMHVTTASFVLVCILIVLALYLIFRFLFRKEAWLRRADRAVLSWFARLGRGILTVPADLWIFPVSSFVMLLMVEKTVNLHLMGMASDRYAFPVQPILCMTLALALLGFVRLFHPAVSNQPDKKRSQAVFDRTAFAVAAVCCGVFALFSQIFYTNPYVFSTQIMEGQQETDDQIRGQDVVVMMNKETSVVAALPVLMDASEVYLMRYGDSPDAAAKKQDFYVLADVSESDEYGKNIDFLGAVNGAYKGKHSITAEMESLVSSAPHLLYQKSGEVYFHSFHYVLYHVTQSE